MLKKNYSPSNAFTLFAVGLALYFAISFCASFFVIILGLFGINLLGEPLFVWIVTVLSQIMLIVAVVVMSGAFKVKASVATGISKKPTLIQILLGIGCVIGLLGITLPLSELFYKFMQLLGAKESSVDLPTTGIASLDLVYMLLFACITPAICEELFMRGALANGFKRFGLIKASLLSAFLFALFHMNYVQTLHQFALGFVLALLVLRSGSLWVAIAMHLFNNIFAVVVDSLISEELYTTIITQYWWATVAVGGIILALCMWLFFKNTPNNFNKEAELDDVMPQESVVFEEDAVLIKQQLPAISKSSKVIFIIALVICVIMWLVSTLGLV